MENEDKDLQDAIRQMQAFEKGDASSDNRQLGPTGSQKVARVQKGGQLKPNLGDIATRQFVIELFAKGYTLRKISTELAAATGEIPDEQVLLDFYINYSDNIEEYRQQLAEHVMRTGLARKEARMTRIAHLIEAYEDPALSDPKAANVYLKSMEQMRREAEPLGIPVQSVQDKWLMLVVALQDTQIEQVETQETLAPAEEIVDISTTTDPPKNKLD